MLSLHWAVGLRLFPVGMDVWCGAGEQRVHLLCLCSCTKQGHYRDEDEQKQRRSAIGFCRALCIPVSPVHTLMFLIISIQA